MTPSPLRCLLFNSLRIFLVNNAKSGRWLAMTSTNSLSCGPCQKLLYFSVSHVGFEVGKVFIQS